MNCCQFWANIVFFSEKKTTICIKICKFAENSVGDRKQVVKEVFCFYRDYRL